MDFHVTWQCSPRPGKRAHQHLQRRYSSQLKQPEPPSADERMSAVPFIQKAEHELLGHEKERGPHFTRHRREEPRERGAARQNTVPDADRTGARPCESPDQGNLQPHGVEWGCLLGAAGGGGGRWAAV